MEKTIDFKKLFIKLVRPQPEEKSVEEIINGSELSKSEKAELINALKNTDERFNKAVAIPEEKRKTKTIKAEKVKLENNKENKLKTLEKEKETEKEIGD